MMFFSGNLSSCGWYRAVKVTRNKSGISRIMMRMAFLLCMGMMMNFILIMRKLTKNYENTFTDLNSSGKHNISPWRILLCL